MGRLEEFDGLRGLLAFWVVFTHILCWCGFAEVRIPSPLSRFWDDFISAQPAVHVFIILSGFAISFLLHRRRQPYGAFITGRFFRLFPVYFFCLALGILTVPLTPFIVNNATWHGDSFLVASQGITQNVRVHLIPYVLTHLTMLHGLPTRSMLPGSSSILLPPAWSISLEWQYYVAAYAIARLVRSGLGTLSLTGVFWLAYHNADRWANPSIAFLPVQLPLFLLGILSYHLYAWFHSAGARKSNGYLVVVFGSIFISILSPIWKVAIIIWAISFGCIFVEGGDVTSNAFKGLRRVLLYRPLQWLGAISYPLYLVHWPILLVLLTILLKYKPTVTSKESLAWLMCVGLPLMLAVATVLHKTLEMPLLRWGKKFGRRGYDAHESVGNPLNAG